MQMLDKDTLLALYRQMLLLREFEQAAARTYREGKIPGFIHLYIGEEAVASGVCAHLETGDCVGSTHRGHAHALAKGVPAREVMAELWGRSTGCSGGRGGSMHLYSKAHGLLGTNGIVGYGLPMAAGAAFTSKYTGSGQVAVAFFGDGAVNLGLFHETLNLASIWALPLVFVCENNLYATELSFFEATAGQSVANRAGAYAIPGVAVDGQDVQAVYHAAGEAVARARAGGGPTLIECLTYRYVGHHEGDPGTGYRTSEEIAKWKKRDPIQMITNRMQDDEIATQAELDRIIADVTQEVQDAVEYSAQSPWPSPADLVGRVFRNPLAVGTGGDTNA
ncbi:MAG: thiamine pyrophosphate-dependent dehydrogenase E1 component subunit alpha [Anaerolineae bacterium]|nr:thiamine pyrophosphate-dependent dehydrogenase E1 component subunit alpha [Anaerolineae bacterium]